MLEFSYYTTTEGELAPCVLFNGKGRFETRISIESKDALTVAGQDMTLGELERRAKDAGFVVERTVLQKLCFIKRVLADAKTIYDKAPVIAASVLGELEENFPEFYSARHSVKWDFGMVDARYDETLPDGDQLAIARHWAKTSFIFARKHGSLKDMREVATESLSTSILDSNFGLDENLPYANLMLTGYSEGRTFIPGKATDKELAVDIVDGAEFPSIFKTACKDWDSSIEEEYQLALKAMTNEMAKFGGYFPDRFSMAEEPPRLALACLAMNGKFTPFSKYGFMSDDGHISSLIFASDASSMSANPSNYVAFACGVRLKA